MRIDPTPIPVLSFSSILLARLHYCQEGTPSDAVLTRGLLKAQHQGFSLFDCFLLSLFGSLWKPMPKLDTKAAEDAPTAKYYAMVSKRAIAHWLQTHKSRCHGVVVSTKHAFKMGPMESRPYCRCSNANHAFRVNVRSIFPQRRPQRIRKDGLCDCQENRSSEILTKEDLGSGHGNIFLWQQILDSCDWLIKLISHGL